MEKITTIEQGVKNFLAVYDFTPTVNWSFERKQKDDLVDALIIDGVKYPLFWWRFDQQLSCIIDYAPSRQICSMKLNEECPKEYGLDALIYKQFDLAETTLRSDIKSIMCFKKPNSLNMITTMGNKTVAVYELAATLNSKAEHQGRHSIWGSNGMASTRVVSQKIATQATYVFLDDKVDPETFNDEVIYTYGLNRVDSTIAMAISMILLGRVDISNWIEKDKKYREYLKIVKESAEKEERIFIGGNSNE